jgi:hypothetical protein
MQSGFVRRIVLGRYRIRQDLDRILLAPGKNWSVIRKNRNELRRRGGSNGCLQSVQKFNTLDRAD